MIQMTKLYQVTFGKDITIEGTSRRNEEAFIPKNYKSQEIKNLQKNGYIKEIKDNNELYENDWSSDLYKSLNR